MLLAWTHDSHSRGLRSNVGIESHSGSGWSASTFASRIVMSGMVADVQQPAVWRSVVPATVHTLAVLALPGVSLVDRSPRRVPGHYAPPRSRALLSSNHGVSRRQAGAATYGRFSVRPLGPLRCMTSGSFGFSGWMPGPRTPPGAQSCADTPTRVRAHRRANPVNETLSVQFSPRSCCAACF